MGFREHRPVLVAMAAMLCVPVLFSGADVPDPARTLPARETLRYAVEWRLITAGSAQLDWSATRNSGRPGWQASLRLESTGLVSKLFKVNNQYTAQLRDDLCALSSHIDVQEGKRLREASVTFNTEARKASYTERDLARNAAMGSGEFDIPPCVYDALGGLFRLRTMRLEPGQSTELPVSDGKKVAMVRVEAQQREEVSTPSGTYRTVRYEAFLFNGVLYRRNAHLYVWLTDDARRLPVQIRIRMQLAIGTVTLQLEKEERS